MYSAFSSNEVYFFTLNFHSTKKEMLSIKGITDVKAEKIFEAASKIEQMGFQSGM